MARFKLRRHRLRGTDSPRLRGALTIDSPTVSAGTAVAGISLSPTKATTMNPNPNPRTVLDIAGVTAGRGIGILNVGVPSRVTVKATQPRAAAPVAAAPKTVGGVVRTPNAVQAAPQSQKRVQGVSSDAEDDRASALPVTPVEPVVAPDPPKRVTGRAKR